MWNYSSFTTPAMSTGNNPTVMQHRTNDWQFNHILSYTQILISDDKINDFLQCSMLSILEFFQNKTGISE